MWIDYYSTVENSHDKVSGYSDEHLGCGSHMQTLCRSKAFQGFEIPWLKRYLRLVVIDAVPQLT